MLAHKDKFPSLETPFHLPQGGHARLLDAFAPKIFLPEILTVRLIENSSLKPRELDERVIEFFIE